MYFILLYQILEVINIINTIETATEANGVCIVWFRQKSNRNFQSQNINSRNGNLISDFYLVSIFSSAQIYIWSFIGHFLAHIFFIGNLKQLNFDFTNDHDFYRSQL